MEKLPQGCPRTPLHCNKLIAPSVTQALPGQPLTLEKAGKGYQMLDCSELPPGTMCPFAQALMNGLGAAAPVTKA